ncbi:hypothetical protein JTB14_033153 [Gonioctena quinquepunctata]|nr:hypothetical protein JTB14_033153 [Gonioctena quinquepunctata]
MNFLSPNKKLDEFKLILEMLNLDITINEPTRVTPTNSSTLDNKLMNTNLDYHSETTDLRISDHNAQILSLKLDNQVGEKQNSISEKKRKDSQ